MNRIALGAVVCLSLFVAAACDSSEERAEEHFQDGLTLLEEGDVDRALVEFRNVFRLNARHKEARRVYAEAEIERGNVSSGYGQYLRLVEQYPDDEPARLELTRLALSGGNWDEVAKHAPHVLEANAEDPIGRLGDIGLRYRQAIASEDAAAQAQIVEEAAALRDELPDNAMIPELLADYYVREGRREEALEEIARAIELSDDPRRLHLMQLTLLQEMGDIDAVEQGLVEMVDEFPADQQVQAALVRWYLSQGKVEQAEAFLRTRADNSGDEGPKIDLVRFLVEYRGADAAITELDRMLEQDPENAVVYRSVRAGLTFEAGQREESIAELESIIDSVDEENDHIRGVKIALARMLVRTGNSVGARALVEEVIASDPNQVEALKMRAAWLIEADEVDDAIQTLRTALEQSPRDPDLMTLMAQAYERSGNRVLMAEMLSLAVEVSNSAPPETIRYARHLLADDKVDIAERALVDSLRLNPGSVELLQQLGTIYVQQGDWQRAEQVADTLASLDQDAAANSANALMAQILTGQGRSEEVLGFLEGLASSGEGGVGATAAIVRTHIENGDGDVALTYIEGKLDENPDDPDLRFLKAAVLETQGQLGEAETIYGELVDEAPQAILVWRALYMLQQRDERMDEAAETLDRALEANPGSPDLQWIKASELQLAGDLEGALDVYAAMYDQNSSAPLIANNYASLLTALREDDVSIARAYSVARRLQGLEVPAFQDTYGWIAYLRGEYETAVEYLEPAAAAIPDDASVQYHVGLAYAATGRAEEAKAALQRAIELDEGGSALPQVEEARQKLAELNSAE